MTQDKICSLDELKRMSKKEILKLNILQLPLPEASIAFFAKRQIDSTRDSSLDVVQGWVRLRTNTSYSLHLPSSTWKGVHHKAVKELLASLEIRPCDIFSYDLLSGKDKEEIL